MKSTFDPISQKIDTYKADRVEVDFGMGDWIEGAGFWEVIINHFVGDSGNLFVQVFEGAVPVGIDSYHRVDENHLKLRILKCGNIDTRFAGSVVINN